MISGSVHDKDQKTPLSGIEIKMDNPPPGLPPKYISTTTGIDGKFSLSDIPLSSGKNYAINLVSRDPKRDVYV